MSYDFYGNWREAKKGIVNGDLCFYLLPQSDLYNLTGQDNGIPPERIVIPQTDKVISCHYFPYLEESDTECVTVQYDNNAFPLPIATSLANSHEMKRVKTIKAKGLNKTVGTFEKYIPTGTTIGGSFNWRNEGKLWLPPFTTIMLSDNIGEPIQINPNLIMDDESSFIVKVRHSLNHLGVYTLYVANYQGDVDGLVYGNTVSGSSFPTISSAYTSYMMENRNQIKLNKLNGLANLLTGLTMVGTGNVGWGVSESVNGVTGLLNQQATERDRLNSGFSLTSNGSDAIHDISMTMGLTCRYLQPLEEHMERMGWFFHLYGYKQNKVMTPNTQSRKYYNFIKTVGVNISANNIPKNHYERLKEIFNSGTTIWHMSNGATVGDYSKDNVEV